MNGEIILTQPAAYGALCALAALVIAGILYWGDRDATRPYRLVLAVLRGLAVGLLAFLLLGPLLRSIDTRTQQPIFLVANDASASARADRAAQQTMLGDLTAQLGDRYDVVEVDFGSTIRPPGDTSADESTNIAALFDYAADQYPAELLGGILLSSDGIYNQGADPTYAAAQLAAPVYTVGLGDTTPTRDVAVRDVLSNRISYLGDRIELQVDVAATGMGGGSTTVSVREVLNNGRTRRIGTETLPIQRSRDFQTIRFETEPTRAGLLHYQVTATGPGDERNVANNLRDVYVDVLDARQWVLILADAPHPDVSALRQALDINKNFEVEFALASTYSGDLAEVDVAIFHNLPSARSSISSVLSALQSRNTGQLYIAGPRTSLPALNEAQTLLSITDKGGRGNAVTPELNGSFRLFTIPSEWAQEIQTFPPALAPFADYSAVTSGEVLLQQRIGKVATDFPMLAMGDVEGQKVGVLSAQDLWRWRLNEYQRNGNHDVFDGLISATVQYLALREDKRPFRVLTSDKIYTTSDNIRLQGELYNASFQLVNDPDVQVSVTDADGADYAFVMDKTSNAYLLNAGRLPAGRYTYRATTSYNGETFTADGGFTVREVQLEATQTTADWQLLQRISSQQGGAFVSSEGISSLSAKLLNEQAAKPVLYQSVRTRPLIDWPWLLAIVVALLAVEWFVRRRLGTY